MRFDDLKAALGPSVQNLDALYAAFVSETKSDDLSRFLDHLRSKGVLSEETLRELAQRDPSGTLARQRPDPGKSKHLAGPTMTTEMLEEDDGGTPIGASARDMAARYVHKNEQGRSAPRPVGPPKATAIMAPPTADRTGAPPPPAVRTANPAPARENSPLHRTPSLPPRPNPTQAGGTPDDVPGRGYKFVGKIGEGAMGEILIAKDLDLHRTVAYKVMSAGIADQPSLAGKFYGEAQITAQLDHPNIVPVYALARGPDGTLSYTMKRIRGYTFEKFVEDTRQQYKARKVDEKHTLTSRLEMFLKVCDAMHYAHSRGVVHRDLKPENIMVGAFGEVYVMDWGIARLMPVDGAGRDDLVLVEGYQEDETPPGMEPDDDDDDDDIQGVIIGTPQYMSPEQAFGRKDLDGRSDQYALGLILWELIALKPAVTGKTAQKIVMRQQDAEKDKLAHAFGESIPPELRAILQKATAKKREDRYTDMQALGDDLRRYLRGESVIAKRDSVRQAVMRWVGRHREITLMAVFALFSLTAVTIFASVGYQLWSSAKAREHEQAMSQLVTSTGAQGALIDSYFARYEGLLGTIGASAAEMLIRGEQTKDPLYWAADFGAEGKRPPDLGPSTRYKIPISVDHPVFLVPPKVQPDLIAPTFQRLTPIQRYFKRVLLMSHADPNAPSYTPKRADRLIRDIGVPMAWVSLGLANGGYVGYPGHGGYPDGYDPRERPWYKLAEKEREALWGAPYIDPAGLGLLLPCSTSIYDEDDKFLGVASVQLPFDFIIGELLGVDQLPEGAESFLVDDDGLIVVRSSEKGKTYDTATLRNRTIRMPEFPVPEVVAAIKDRESGKLEVYEGGRSDLVLYNRMNSLGWYYVVRGEAGALLAASKN